jgi:hypothetical protein
MEKLQFIQKASIFGQILNLSISMRNQENSILKYLKMGSWNLW